MPINLEPINDEGLPLGHWVTYFSNGQLSTKGDYINGKRNGYWESYWHNGKLHFKGTYHLDEEIGYWNYSQLKVFYAN